MKEQPRRHPTDKELEAALPAMSVEARIEAILSKYVGGAMSRHYDGQTNALTAERRIAAELMRRIKPWLADAQVASQSPAPRSCEHDPDWDVVCPDSGCGRGNPRTATTCLYCTTTLAAPAPPRAQDWQPIETAPKDGRWLLVCDRKNVTGDGIVMARYDSDCDCWFDGVGMDDLQPLEPTHWMPLPSPPDA